MVEVCVGTAIGYLVALLTQLLVFPLFGLAVAFTQNLLIGAIFTAVSLLRSYWVRRLFNWMHQHENN